MQRPTVPEIWKAKGPEGLPQLTIGEIINVHPGGTYVTMRVGIGSTRTVRDVIVADGLELAGGDHVLAAHVGDSPRWVIITRVLDTDAVGLNIGNSLGENQLNPPNNFSVDGGVGLVIASWEGWPGNTVCWQVQHNSSATETGASTFYTRGSYFLYPSVSIVTHYARVRAVRYNVGTGQAFYSRWSSWDSATSYAATGSGTSDAIVGSGTPHFRIDGPLTTGTNVGGKWRFGGSGEIYGVAMCVKDNGSTGQTRVDVNLNGVSLWLLESSQPELRASEPDLCTSISTPDVSDVNEGDVLTIDIDAAATTAYDLDVFVYMQGNTASVGTHAHSGGPHTGLLDFDELQYSGFLPRLMNRQGSDNTNWNAVGSTNFTPSGTRMEVGAISVPALDSTTITFASAFSGRPLIFLGPGEDEGIAIGQVSDITTSSFVCTNGNTDALTVFWMAIGAS